MESLLFNKYTLAAAAVLALIIAILTGKHFYDKALIDKGKEEVKVEWRDDVKKAEDNVKVVEADQRKTNRTIDAKSLDDKVVASTKVREQQNVRQQLLAEIERRQHAENLAAIHATRADDAIADAERLREQSTSSGVPTDSGAGACLDALTSATDTAVRNYDAALNNAAQVERLQEWVRSVTEPKKP